MKVHYKAFGKPESSLSFECYRHLIKERKGYSGSPVPTTTDIRAITCPDCWAGILAIVPHDAITKHLAAINPIISGYVVTPSSPRIQCQCGDLSRPGWHYSGPHSLLCDDRARPEQDYLVPSHYVDNPDTLSLEIMTRGAQSEPTPEWAPCPHCGQKVLGVCDPRPDTVNVEITIPPPAPAMCPTCDHKLTYHDGLKRCHLGWSQGDALPGACQCGREATVSALNPIMMTLDGITPAFWREMSGQARDAFINYWRSQGQVSFVCLTCGFPTVRGQSWCESCNPSVFVPLDHTYEACLNRLTCLTCIAAGGQTCHHQDLKNPGKLCEHTDSEHPALKAGR